MQLELNFSVEWKCYFSSSHLQIDLHVLHGWKCCGFPNTHSNWASWVDKKMFHSFTYLGWNDELWYTYIYIERRKKNPSKFGFMDGNVVVSPRHSNSASWVDGKMFSFIHKFRTKWWNVGYIYLYIERKTHPNFGFRGWKCCGFPNTHSNWAFWVGGKMFHSFTNLGWNNGMWYTKKERGK
jgi:hypothetical protein